VRARTFIVEGPLPPLESEDTRADAGSELIFHGRVRGKEHGEALAALDYEYYPVMAERVLQELAEGAASRFGVAEVCCWHRVGEVPVGHASLRVVVWSAHRAEGLACLGWFISALKRDVPIWKWAITVTGERFASHCDRDHDSEIDAG